MFKKLLIAGGVIAAVVVAAKVLAVEKTKDENKDQEDQA